MNLQSFSTLFDLLRAFPTEQSCIEHYEKLRWSNGVVSPYDPTFKVYNYGGGKYRCKNTGNDFAVTGTHRFGRRHVLLAAVGIKLHKYQDIGLLPVTHQSPDGQEFLQQSQLHKWGNKLQIHQRP